ncbi:MAG: DNA repair protein RecO [Patescibacteria group bacterium]|jgi:DNA repair protein RecO (recombination protein O)|nr:DNA repair protein RecO [Patescibacteria group bacterium]
MQTYKAYGLVIKRSNIGEADRIITIFSKEFGKIRFVAKGSRKTKSKLAGSLEPFYFSSFIITKGKSLDILTSATIEKVPLKNERNLDLIKTVSFFAELVDKMWPEHIPNSELFDLLEEVFSYLGANENIDLVRFYFESKFYQLSGFFPETSVCVRCGQKTEENLYFSPYAGGIIDSNCSTAYGDSQKITSEAAKVWRFASQNSYHNFKKIMIPNDIRHELVKISNCYLGHVTQREFNSDKI